MQQGTEEWFKAKLGRIGASRVHELLPKKTGGYYASRKNLMADLIVQELTGVYESIPPTAAMRHGTETEPLARMAYEDRHGIVDEEGFVMHPTIKRLGASPDGRVFPDGGLEIKCPNTATHIETFLTGKVDREYIVQMNTNMMVFKATWWDFVSFDNRLPEDLEYYEKRFLRDESLCDTIESEVNIFVRELEEKLLALKSERRS